MPMDAGGSMLGISFERTLMQGDIKANLSLQKCNGGLMYLFAPCNYYNLGDV